MNLLAERTASVATLSTIAVDADPDRQAAEEFYHQGRLRPPRGLTISASGPDANLHRRWLASQLEIHINRLLSLESGWDDEGANEVTDEAVRAAVAVVGRLVTEVALMPFLFPLPDGGMQVEWHAGQQSVEVEIDPAGEAHLLITDEDGAIVANREIAIAATEDLRLARQAVAVLSVRVLATG